MALSNPGNNKAKNQRIRLLKMISFIFNNFGSSQNQGGNYFMRKFLSIFVCIMSCFLIVGCSSSSKMDGNWIYDHYEVKNTPSNTTITDLSFIIEVITIKNGYIRVNESSYKVKLEKAQFKNGIQYYAISEATIMENPIYIYYNEADDTIVLVISDGDSLTFELIFKRK